MLFELITLGGVFSYIIAAAIFGLLIYLVEFDYGMGSLFLLIGTAVASWLFTAFNPFLWVYTHSSLVGLYAVAYVFVGILWGVLKWYFYLLNVAHAAASIKAKMTSPYKVSDI